MSTNTQSPLEAAQTAYDEYLKTFYFKLNMGDLESEVSPPLKVKQGAIQLRLYRYGLFYEEAEQTTINPGGPMPEDLPEVERFKYVKTTLNKGYVYIMDEQNPDLWYEYQTLGEGKLRPIIWDQNKDEKGAWSDVRHSSKEHDPSDQLIFKEDSVLWVAYSPVQWSVAYHKQIKQDAKLRAQRMTKVECRGFAQDEKAEADIVPYDQMTASFKAKDHGFIEAFNTTKTTLDFDNKGALEQDENATKNDLFITLHDPWGCAYDIFEHLGQCNLEHRTLIDAILRGEDPKHQALVQLALFTLNYVYKDKESIKRYSANIAPKDKEKYPDIAYTQAESFYSPTGNFTTTEHVSVTTLGQDGADLEKIYGILGGEERRQTRKKVQEARESFGTFIQTDYFRTFFNDFKDNTQESKLEWHHDFLAFLEELMIAPEESERILEPSSTHKNTLSEPDTWQKLVFDLVNEPDCEYNQEQINQSTKGIINQFWGVVLKDWEIRKKQALLTQTINGKAVTNMQEVVSILCEDINGRFFNKGQTKFRVDNKKLSLILGEHNIAINLERVKLKTRNAGNVAVLYLPESQVALRTSIEGKKIIDLPVTRQVELKGIQKSLNNFNKATAHLLDSPYFNAFLGGLQLLCLQEVIGDVKAGSGNRVKSYIDLAATTSGITEAVLKVQAGIVKNLGTEPSRLLKGKIQFAGAATGYLAAGSCIFDGVLAFMHRDQDAGGAYVAAGVAFGVSTTFTSVLPGLAIAGPIGLLTAALGFALLITAYALTDTEIQKYFKYYILSNDLPFPKNENESPTEYAQRILENKEALMGKRPSEQALNQWMDPEAALKSFYDLIVCTQITFHSKAVATEMKTFASTTSPVIFSFTHITSRFLVELSFQQFFKLGSDQSVCETHAYFFPKGIKKGNEEDAGSNFPWEAAYNEKQIPVVKIDVSLNKDKMKKIKNKSQLLVLVRIVNSGTDLPSFPLSWQQYRYIAAYIDLHDINDLSTIKTKEVRIDTMDNLLNPRLWK